MGDLNPEWTLTGVLFHTTVINVYSPPNPNTVELRKEIGMSLQQQSFFNVNLWKHGLRINGIKDKAVLDQTIEESLGSAQSGKRLKTNPDSALGLQEGNNNVCLYCGTPSQRLSFLTNQRRPSALTAPLVRLRALYNSKEQYLVASHSFYAAGKSYLTTAFSLMENSSRVFINRRCSIHSYKETEDYITGKFG